MGGPSLAWYAAVEAIARHVPERPLPAGINTATVGDWDLTLNQSAKPAMNGDVEMPPFGVQAAHRQYLVLAVLDPAGGMIGGGMTEDEFIKQMEAA